MLMDGQTDITARNLAKGLEAMVGWLRLNPAKTDVFWLSRVDSGVRHQLLILGHALLTPAQMVKSLGVFLDVSLSVEAQLHILADWHYSIYARSGN